MKVLMVLESEFPPDERVEKEIESLQGIGFSVTIAVYTFKKKPEVELFNGYRIYRKSISPLLYRSSAAILLVPFYSFFWYRFLNVILRKEKFDIIHIHDLPLSKIGYRLSQKYNLKMVCDQHEYYSNWIIRTKHYNTGVGKIIRFFSNWSGYERRYLQKADLVITVENSLKRIYIENVCVPPSKIITLPNTPRKNDFNTSNIDPEVINKYKNYFVLFYGGSLDHIRGIDFIAECVAKLKDEISNILFLIAGKENRAFDMGKMICGMHLENFVDYVGWVPLDKLPSFIAASKICLFVPKADNLEINNTIATKIYQYASMGKPVIVSEAKMMRDFIENNAIGFSVRYGDIDGFCEIVRKIYKNPAIIDEIASRAIRIAGDYIWEKTSRDFIDYYVGMKL
jgi:glycosyltransferase involved in cell wall biosynthesis